MMVYPRCKQLRVSGGGPFPRCTGNRQGEPPFLAPVQGPDFLKGTPGEVFLPGGVESLHFRNVGTLENTYAKDGKISDKVKFPKEFGQKRGRIPWFPPPTSHSRRTISHWRGASRKRTGALWTRPATEALFRSRSWGKIRIGTKKAYNTVYI